MIHKLISRTVCSCASQETHWSHYQMGQYAFDVTDYLDKTRDSNGDILFIKYCTTDTKHKCNCKYCYHYDKEQVPKCKGSVDRWRGYRSRDVGGTFDRRRDNQYIPEWVIDECDWLENTLSIRVNYGMGSRGSNCGQYVILRDVVGWLKANNIKRSRVAKYRGPDIKYHRLRFEAAQLRKVAMAVLIVRSKQNSLHIEALKENQQREREKKCLLREEITTGNQLLKQSRVLALKLSRRASPRLESQALESSTL